MACAFFRNRCAKAAVQLFSRIKSLNLLGFFDYLAQKPVGEIGISQRILLTKYQQNAGGQATRGLWGLINLATKYIAEKPRK